MRYQQKYYEADSHNTVPLISIYDGLRFIFDYYPFDPSAKDFADSSASIASQLKAHYSRVSANMGYSNSAPESLINYFAYEALGKKRYSKAKALFALNVDWYPESPKVYAAYGDYFVALKDTIHALTNYQKALAIQHHAETQRKIDQLMAKKSPNNAVHNLQKYAGVYVLETYNIPVVLEVSDATLWAKMAGKADYEFQYLSDHTFTVKGKQGYSVTFQMEDHAPKGFTSVQPTGTFKAVFKNR